MDKDNTPVDFEGHQFVKLDKKGCWVLDITENNVYAVVLNSSGEAQSYKLAMTLSDKSDLHDRFIEMPIVVVRRAIKKYNEIIAEGKVGN